MDVDKELIEKILEATILCMDYPLSQITDDGEYDRAVDLQNDLKSSLENLKDPRKRQP